MPAEGTISWTKARSDLANTIKADPTNVEAITEKRRQLKAARLADHIARVVAEAPPLTKEQRDKLALLLRGSSDSGGAAA